MVSDLEKHRLLVLWFDLQKLSGRGVCTKGSDNVCSKIKYKYSDHKKLKSNFEKKYKLVLRLFCNSLIHPRLFDPRIIIYSCKL